jgi:hypothetical protein
VGAATLGRPAEHGSAVAEVRFECSGRIIANMPSILIGDKSFEEVPFENEADLESAAISNKRYIFGEDCVYFNYKRRTGAKESRNVGIPDGFLIDFSNSKKPQLFFVEYELESHNLYEHIGPQVMRFYASFETGQRELQLKLTGIIKQDPDLRAELERKIKETPFANTDSLFNYVIFDQNAGIILIIDEQTEDLNSLLRRLSEAPEVIVLKKFQTDDETIYQYDPFREGVAEVETTRRHHARKERMADVDTIVCPAREDGFKEAFLDKSAWWAIRLSPSLIPQLKWIAMYESLPVSAVRWIGKIQENGVKPYKNTGKYIIAVGKKLRIRPIKLDSKKKGAAPQAPRYTTYEKLRSAKGLSDLW